MTRFIDVHVHPPVPAFLDGAFAPYVSQLEEYFKRPLQVMSGDELADYYREREGRAVLLGWDARTATGLPPFTTREVAELVEAHPDVFWGFGSVDPHRGAAAVAGVHEAARLGMKGLKLHPSAQRFTPSDREFFPIWEAAEEQGLVCLFHTGFTGLGAGSPGGMGVRQHHAHPMHLDEVAAEFPALVIIAAHPSWPWQDDALALARHKPNVYLELSGWSPKYLAPSLMEAVQGYLQDRTLFGTDFPFLTPDKWLKDWAGLGVPDEVTAKIVYGNAAALLTERPLHM